MTVESSPRELKTTPLIERTKEVIQSLLAERELLLERMYQYKIDMRLDVELEANCASKEKLLSACDKALLGLDAELYAAKIRLSELIAKEFESGNLVPKNK